MPRDDASDGPEPSRRRVLRTLGAATAAGVATAGRAGADHEDGGDDDLAGLQLETGDPCEWERTDDSHLPFETDGYGGWGGHEFLNTEPGVDHYPMVFAHGNTRDACDFLGHADYFTNRGVGGDALWAITFGREGSTHDEMRNQLDGFVAKVCEYTGVGRVRVLGHSLGVTGLRYWMDGLDDYPDRYDRVDGFVGLAGANHGTWTCGPGCEEGPGTARVCQFISHACADTPGEPLYELNHPDETPGDGIDYYTLRGSADEFFAVRPESPVLAGAEANVEMDTDHDGVRTEPAAVELVYQWLVRELDPGARRRD
ncbi:hypothetical protein BRC94_10140 [Halobacteriales archaeon QS_5_70_17]|nr:MAG: hypothetical protein BRC94_10140 [Halobacteriales archaeon QS_5_70_17]